MAAAALIPADATRSREQRRGDVQPKPSFHSGSALAQSPMNHRCALCGHRYIKNLCSIRGQYLICPLVFAASLLINARGDVFACCGCRHLDICLSEDGLALATALTLAAALTLADACTGGGGTAWESDKEKRRRTLVRAAAQHSRASNRYERSTGDVGDTAAARPNLALVTGGRVRGMCRQPLVPRCRCGMAAVGLSFLNACHGQMVAG